VTRILAISAGASNPSSTRKLADRLTEAVRERAPRAEVELIDVRELAHDLLNATTSGLRSPEVSQAVAQVSQADAVIAVTPVFNGAYSGLFKLFFDVLDEGTLADVPVLLGATGGTPRHSLAIDQTLVPLFFYLRARPLPWPVYAATDDWSDPRGLNERIGRAADALVADIGHQTTGASRARVQPDDDFTLTKDFEAMLAELG
jgi:FMN reductase